MAEFQEVIKQRQRMCRSQEICLKCPIYTNQHDKEIDCKEFLFSNPDSVEKIVMQWASANPEPVYPTWVDWWDENFNSDGRRMFTPCSFVSPKELGCSFGHDGCMVAPYKCWHTRIPAEVAQKLGIKPIENQNEAK